MKTLDVAALVLNAGLYVVFSCIRFLPQVIVPAARALVRSREKWGR